MSEKKTKFLTDVDRLVLKLDEIIINAGGKKENNYKNIKDDFEHLRLQINNDLKEVETLLSMRDIKLNSTISKDLYERRKIENKLENLFEQIEIKMKKLKQELKIAKKKEGKYGNFSQKEKIVNLMEEKNDILKNKLYGVDMDIKQIEENKSKIEQLEEILKKENKINEERELTNEEKRKKEEWDNEVISQNEELDDIHNKVKEIKNEVNLANKNIEKTHLTVNNLTKNTEKTTKNVKSKNKKLKELIEKLRSGDKLCVYIILILIALGLIGVLYNLIKMKLF